MKFITKILGVVTLGILISISNIQAGSIATNNKAIAILSSTCSITGTNVDFGNLTAIITPTTLWATGGVQILCSKNAAYSIQLSLGNNVDPNNWRRMIGASSGALIQYTLCQTQSSGGTFGTATGGCTVAWRGLNIQRVQQELEPSKTFLFMVGVLQVFIHLILTQIQ